MKKERHFSQWLSENMDLPVDSMPGKCIVEIAEDNRVLVENHQGVIQYGSCLIEVKVYYGTLQVKGCNLILARMTCEQLIISGKIEAVILIRRKRS